MELYLNSGDPSGLARQCRVRSLCWAAVEPFADLLTPRLAKPPLADPTARQDQACRRPHHQRDGRGAH